MAIVNGFELTTPTELRAQAQARLDQMRAQGGQAAQAANSQQVISALFGSPEIQKAQETQSALSDAMGSVTQETGESDLDFQTRQQVAIRSAMVDVDPNIVMQANDNLVGLQAQALANKKLQVGTASDENDLKNAMQTTVDGKTPVIFKMDPDGVMEPIKTLQPGATLEEVEAAKEKALQDNPEGRFVTGSVLDIYELEGVSLTSRGGIPGSKMRAIEEELEGSQSFMFSAGQFLEQMITAPQALVGGKDLIAEGAGFATGVKRLISNFMPDDPEAQDDDFEIIERWFGEDGAKLTVLGIESSIAQGMVLNMAYTLAKSLDSGGRLSDQDVDMAIQMITGRGDPESLKRLMRIRLDGVRNKTETHKMRAQTGALNGAIGLDKWSRYEKAMTSTYDKLEAFDAVVDKIMGEGGLANFKPAFAGDAGGAGSGAKVPSQTDTEEVARQRAALQKRMEGLN